jgi:nucleotide-binding universal stress UspA family protein
MFSTIVVGTDGSQTARRAVVVAADLARRLDAELHVVHGYQDPSLGSGGIGQPVESMWHRASEAVLDDAMADPVLEGIKACGHSVAGAPHEAIVAVATEISADLIVVGNRGMHSVRAPTDSVPITVAHEAPCHVLIAKTT